ncbi:hypothetical protein RND81_02G177800 [Saponaria officinalis]|uniref:Chalcone/stilbene synthase N-terminal domain-containing protein n=1 Tax=Saponaria officinalis TaxID=3572 RepID=A0AAW1MR38_SAPOF
MGLENIKVNGMRKKPTARKATLLSIGKGFPHTLVMQEFLVDGYFRNTTILSSLTQLHMIYYKLDQSEKSKYTTLCWEFVTDKR